MKKKNNKKKVSEAEKVSFSKLQPLLSEKSLGQAEELNTYLFLTESKMRKPEIKKLVEKIYGVSVDTVRTINSVTRLQVNRFGQFGGKKFKKCYVRLKEGSKINLTAGV